MIGTHVANDSCVHAAALRKMINTVVRCARIDAARATDLRAQLLFEHTAEELAGLAAALASFEYESEHAAPLQHQCL